VTHPFSIESPNTPVRNRNVVLRPAVIHSQPPERDFTGHLYPHLID
jgi:hypothetical protein